MLISYHGAQPQELPQDYADKTEVELNALGIVVCPNKPACNPGQVVFWQFGMWNIREATESEREIQWQTIKNEVVRLLSETDYKVLKAYENAVPVDQTVTTYRQLLRDIYNNVNDINPFQVTWPTL